MCCGKEGRGRIEEGRKEGRKKGRKEIKEVKEKMMRERKKREREREREHEERPPSLARFPHTLSYFNTILEAGPKRKQKPKDREGKRGQ